MKLEGKVAIITGGARGNGLATAKLMAEEGADIVITDICENMNTIPYDMSTEETMAGAVESIKAMGRKALGVKCDVRKSAEIEAMVEQVMETFGKIDILVNNAGNSSMVAIAEMDEETWDEVLDTHLKGTYLCSPLRAAPHDRTAQRQCGEHLLGGRPTWLRHGGALLRRQARHHRFEQIHGHGGRRPQYPMQRGLSGYCLDRYDERHRRLFRDGG